MYDAAIVGYSQAIETRTYIYTYIYIHITRIQTRMQMYDAAIVDCRKAIELKSDFSKAYSRLGTAHFQVCVCVCVCVCVYIYIYICTHAQTIRHRTFPGISHNRFS